MPTPNTGESRDDFIERCIPMVIEEGTAANPDQAVAVCNTMWKDHTKEGKQQLYLEAQVKPSGKLTGREWEVTIIGAKEPGDVVNANGREYLISKNGRLYDMKALAASAPLWDGVKVYDNHLTQEEFERKQGMRSPANEWLGTIVRPRWDAGKKQLRGIFKVVEDRLAAKLKSAWEQGVLNAIGLSIDTFPIVGADAVVEGQRMPVIEGFKKILSVDLVGDPAAGGGFERLIAAVTQEQINMDKEELAALLDEKLGTFKDELPELVKQHVVSAAEAEAEEDDEELEVDELSDDEVLEAIDERRKQKEAQKLTEAQKRLVQLRQETEKTQRETALARTELMVIRALDRARLPEKFEEAVRAQFDGRVVDKADIDKAVKLAKEAHASLDPTGRVKAGGGNDVQVGLNEEERVSLEFLRIMMGNVEFKELEHSADEGVRERVKEAKAYKSWVSAGKPDLPRYNRISTLLYDWFGGDPLLDPRASEAATTSTLSTVVKNTVNIMTANDYSQREQWWAPIVRTEEVDTIDDATLARVYGVDTLDVVNEGGPYTELVVADDEETAAFVKRGNYIGITIETLMRDKIQYIRRIPGVLADTWFNTQSDLVANVFTVNTAAGPVLGDAGALFNSTATSTPGGHANQLTTALSHAAYSAARTAMRKQTDQPLGDGRKLLLRPRYMLVPVDLETTALEIRNAELEPGADFDTSGGGAQTPNIFRNEFDVIVVPSWTDATNWALVADPMQAAAIWLVYPRGQRTPQVFSAESETGGSMFTNDELRFKVRLMTYRFSATYDCAPVSDFRPLHHSLVAG